MQIEEETTIDHNLYSRQIGAFGVKAMKKLVKLRVMLVGLSGVGIETAKNLILSGPKAVSIFDNRICQKSDHEFNYYMKSEDIAQKKTRAQALLNSLAVLNSYVDVNILENSNFVCLNDPKLLANFDLVLVCDFYPLDQVQALNMTLRNQNKGLICTATAGMFGFIFTDFGDSHKIFDKNGETLKQVLITSIEQDGTITTEEKKRHDLEEGDWIKLIEVVGMEGMNEMEFKVEKVLTPFSLKVENLSKHNFGSYQRNGILKEVKKTIIKQFVPLQFALEEPLTNLLDCDMDFSNFDRIYQIKTMLKTLWKYISIKGRPEFFDRNELNLFINEFKKDLQGDIAKFEHECNKNNKEGDPFVSKKDWLNILDTNVPELLFSLSKGCYSPVCSFFGGIAAQEAVKFTGKFTPIDSLFMNEFYSRMFKNKKFEEIAQNAQDVQADPNSRYISQLALLGKNLHQQIEDAKVFLVGAGALGCEYLKMFSLMGMSSSKTGKFVVTDDDTIEVSNLNRQFLFRKIHIGKYKSVTACQEAKKFNQNFNVEGKVDRVSPNTENLFTDVFWDNLSFVVNAVDNVKARVYVDAKSVLHDKILFESGTLGTKCNSQLIIPNQTECYSDSQDPPETGYPQCTMRSFPYLIEHCIEFARSKFFEMFVKSSSFFAEFFENPTKAQQNLKKKLKNNLAELKEILEFLETYIPILSKPTLEEYVKLSIQIYQNFFDTTIAELISLFPPDCLNKEGNLFWSSPKRPPIPIPFDKTNQDHVNFVLSTIKILHQMIPLQELANKQVVKQILNSMKIVRKKVNTNTQDKAKLLDNSYNEEASDDDGQRVMNVVSKILELMKKNDKLLVKEVEFEKDDDQNGHIDFITFFSNFRALNYSIPIAPRHKIKLIAGKIIPAIATTTAMVCGSIGIEIYKTLLNVDFDEKRNFFSNLAIPIFSFSEPAKPLVRKDKKYDVIVLGPLVTIPKNWDTWTKIEVKGPMTLQQMRDHLKEKYKFNVSSVVLQNMELWSSYSMNKDNSKLSMNLDDIIASMGRTRYPGKKYEVLSISGENDEDVDVYCPIVKYYLG